MIEIIVKKITGPRGKMYHRACLKNELDQLGEDNTVYGVGRKATDAITALMQEKIGEVVSCHPNFSVVII